MFEIIFLLCLAIAYLIFASMQDLKTTEIANWLVFSMAIFAIAFRFFYGLFYEGDFMFFYQGLIGLGIFFILGNLMYYAKFFAGGDAKLMIALGAILPLSREFMINLRLFLLFFILFLVVGAVYGLLASIFLAIKNSKEFKKGFPKVFSQTRWLIIIGNLCGVIIICLGFIDSYLFLFGVLIFLLPYLYVYSKSIDEYCMIRKIKTKDLMEGDWITRNFKIGKKLIKYRWDGLSEKEIKLIQKTQKEINIRRGVAFAPVFLFSFILFSLSFLELINLFGWFFFF
jgi:Flp pilus assembly protein protease CpaA